MKKIITLVLAAIMVCTLFVACKGNSGDNVESYTVKLTIKNGETVIHGPESITIEAEDNYYPTVLDVVMQYVNDSEGEITAETASRTLAGKTSTELIAIDSAKKTDSVFWQVLINNKTQGINTEIWDGDDIVVFLDKNADVTDTEPVTTAAPEVQTANDDYNG